MRINLANHLSSKFIILFLSITFCSGSGVDESKLATDSEMVWCLSNSDYVSVGSSATLKGWETVEIGSKYFSKEEVILSKKLFNTLKESILMTEFVTTEYNEETGVYASTNKERYINAITSREDGYNAYNDVGWLFGNWRNSKLIYLQNDDIEDIDINKKRALKLKKEADYINAYTVCKLWYEVNN